MVAEDGRQSFHSILKGKNVDQSTIATAMRLSRRGSNADIELANSLVGDSGYYLPVRSIRRLIRADTSRQEIEEEISQQKIFFYRLSILLPSLLLYFSDLSIEQLPNMLNCIDDCYHDFRIMLISPRHDKAKREEIHAFNRAIESVQKSVEALQRLNEVANEEFDTLFSIWMKRVHGTDNAKESIKNLVYKMELLIAALEISRQRIKDEEDYIYINGNQVRSCVVDYAFTMSNFWGGPSLVTTPNSDFSMICSMLFEICSGIRDEGLAGAISRYARSDDRKEKGEYNRNDYIDDPVLKDNFYQPRNSAERAIKDAEAYIPLMANISLSPYARALAKQIVQDRIEAANAAAFAYGPNLPLSMSQAENDDWYDKQIAELEARIRDMTIKLGRQRRAGGHSEST